VCDLVSDPTAERCDCGFDFTGRVVTEGDPDYEKSLSGGEDVLRRTITFMPPRIWLWLTLFATGHLVGWPVALAFLGSVLAALFYVSIVWQVDYFEAEPWRLVERTLLWGAVPAIVLSLVGELLLSGPARFLVGSAQVQWFEAGFIAPVVEELAKGIVLVTLYRRHREEFDGMLDGLVYGALVGLGFSMTENLTYYLNQPDNVNGLIMIRGLLFGMNHACFSACFGFGLGVASDTTDPALRRWAPVAGLAAGIGLHMTSNLILLRHTPPSAFVAVALSIGALLVWFRLVSFAREREGQWIDEELAEEVRRGVLSAHEAAEVSNVQLRKAARLDAVREGTYGAAHSRLQRYALGTELAFAKHKARANPLWYKARIEALRRRVAQIRAGLGR
jgi:RsiW-degrading membrane proteinase PrsW (M82 family)